MTVLKIFALIVVLAFLYFCAWVWVSSLISNAIRNYFTEREKYRKKMDGNIEQLLKDYPRA